MTEEPATDLQGKCLFDVITWGDFLKLTVHAPISCRACGKAVDRNEVVGFFVGHYRDDAGTMYDTILLLDEITCPHCQQVTHRYAMECAHQPEPEPVKLGNLLIGRTNEKPL